MSNKIKSLRTEKRITQLQLSIDLGVTQETISAYEHGRHLPTVANLIKMSEIFDASTDYILGLSPIRQIQATDSTFTDEQRTVLLNCYALLGSKNKARLISYAQGLLDSQKD